MVLEGNEEGDGWVVVGDQVAPTGLQDKLSAACTVPLLRGVLQGDGAGGLAGQLQHVAAGLEEVW